MIILNRGDILKNIKIRKSVRTYSNKELSPTIKSQLIEYLRNLEKSYDGKFRFPLVDSDNLSDGKIGTYGVIRGARFYICGIIRKDSLDLLELGYAFEKIILFSTSLGLGTCWLGGTFNRTNFAKSAGLKDDEMFIIATPVGHIKDKKSFIESAMRKLAKSDNRKSFNELFFDKKTSKPLEKDSLGEFGLALEMVRIGPSASNKQPWIIIKDDDRYDFFLKRTPDYASSLDFDIQMLDIGIAMCHFEVSLDEQGIKGSFKKLDKNIPNWNNCEYVISFII